MRLCANIPIWRLLCVLVLISVDAALQTCPNAAADESYDTDTVSFGKPVADSLAPANTWSHTDQFGSHCSTLSYKGGLLSYSGKHCDGTDSATDDPWTCDWSRAVRNYPATKEHPFGPVEIARGKTTGKLLFWIRACDDPRTDDPRTSVAGGHYIYRYALGGHYTSALYGVDSDATMDALRAWFLKQYIYDIRDEMHYVSSRLSNNLPDRSLMQISCLANGVTVSEGLSITSLIGTTTQPLEYSYIATNDASHNWKISSNEIVGALVMVVGVPPPNAVVMLQLKDGSKRQLNRICAFDRDRANSVSDNINASLPLN